MSSHLGLNCCDQPARPLPPDPQNDSGLFYLYTYSPVQSKTQRRCSIDRVSNDSINAFHNYPSIASVDLWSAQYTKIFDATLFFNGEPYPHPFPSMVNLNLKLRSQVLNLLMEISRFTVLISGRIANISALSTSGPLTAEPRTTWHSIVFDRSDCINFIPKSVAITPAIGERGFSLWCGDRVIICYSSEAVSNILGGKASVLKQYSTTHYNIGAAKFPWKNNCSPLPGAFISKFCWKRHPKHHWVYASYYLGSP